MSAGGLSASITREVFLWPAMDARAANVEQQTLIFNPSTPQVDSLIEHLDVLADRGQLPSSSLKGMVALSTRLSASNSAEAGFELAIAGAADQLARDLRDDELNGAPVKLSSKAIARRLRCPLRTLAQPAGVSSADLFRACRTIGDTVREVPRLQLLSPAVAHELGRAKYELLERIVVADQKTGPAQLETARPEARGSSHGSA